MPVLHLDPDQPKRLRIESKAFESDALRQLGCHWRGRGADYFHCAKALPAVYGLKGFFKDKLIYGPGVVDWLTEENARWIANATWLRSVDADPYNLPDTVGRMEPILAELRKIDAQLTAQEFVLRPFQRAGVSMLVNSQRVVLGDEPGTGKSVQGTVGIMVAQAAFGDALPALIIAPRSTLEATWERIFHKLAPDLKVMVLTGTPAKRRKLLEKFVDDEYDVMITSYGMVKEHSRSVNYGGTALKRCVDCGGPKSEKEIAANKCEAHMKELNGIPWATVVVDEAHHIFDQTTAQTRAILGVAHYSPSNYRWAMTGTPVEGSPLNLWSLLRYVDPEPWASSSVFRDRYTLTQTSWQGFQEVVGLRPDTLNELRLATAPFTLRRLRCEVLAELPAAVKIDRMVELSAKERKQYNTFVEEALVEVEGGDLFAMNPASIFIRSIQLACSSGSVDHSLNPDGSIDIGFAPAYPSSLLAEVEDARTGEYKNQRIVFYCASSKLLDLYAGKLLDCGARFSMIQGSVDGDARVSALDSFNNGSMDYLLLTSAGGEGISVTDCDTMFVILPETSRIKDEQMHGRLLGLGRGKEGAESIQYVRFIPEGTVIESIYHRLESKSLLSDNVLGDTERKEMLSMLRGEGV